MRSADPAQWRAFLLDRGLDSALAENWASFARPNIRLMPSSTFDCDSTPAGTSKLGGEPDLPANSDWPSRPAYQYDRQRLRDLETRGWAEWPLDFIAQINLRDVGEAGTDLPLPESGLLLFFYDSVVQPWGFDPKDKPGWQVRYVAEGEEVRRRSHPHLGLRRVQPLELLRSEGLPGWEWIKMNGAGTVSWEWLRELTDEDCQSISYGGHAFGGWPSPQQAPMEHECEMVSNGVYAGRTVELPEDDLRRMNDNARNWRMLLQVGSDDDLDWMWGDCGNLYFMCRDSDISVRRFDRGWTILQCG